MGQPSFKELLEAQWAKGRHVCVGLDSEVAKIPAVVTGDTPAGRQAVFNVRMVSSTHEFAAAYKLNFAFYLALGPDGLVVMRDTIQHIRDVAPDAVVIVDCKFGDIDNTNLGYVEFAFGYLDADAVTVAPYMGGESLAPFLNKADKGIFVLSRTSNKGAKELQNLRLYDWSYGDGVRAIPTPLYRYLVGQVHDSWNKSGNCGLVVGATAPEELADVRRLVPDLPILIPGVGAQGGDLEKSVAAAKGRFLINSSRGIIFAQPQEGEDGFAAARRETEKLHNSITQCLLPAGTQQ